MWYYLSRDEWLNLAITEVRPPVMAFGESTEPRLCIAPTVSQCILALANQEGVFNIYMVAVNNPIEADDSVGDRNITSERWITQQVLHEHNGSIGLVHAGTIEVESQMRLALKIAIRHKVQPGWEQNEARIYEIAEDRWTLVSNDAGIIATLLNGG